MTVYEVDKSQGWLRSILTRLRKEGSPPGGPEGLRRRPKVGLALRGGVPRGLAHPGVLRCLEQHGSPLGGISGTSAGPLAAVSFGSRHPFEYIVKEAGAIRFGNFGQWRFSRMGLASNRRLESYPQDPFGVSDFK